MSISTSISNSAIDRHNTGVQPGKSGPTRTHDPILEPAQTVESARESRSVGSIHAADAGASVREQRSVASGMPAAATRHLDPKGEGIGAATSPGAVDRCRDLQKFMIGSCL